MRCRVGMNERCFIIKRRLGGGVLTGLLASLVLSTLFSPTSDLARDSADLAVVALAAASSERPVALASEMSVEAGASFASFGAAAGRADGRF